MCVPSPQVNFLEHYGLERRKNEATGAYEPVQPQHSWDSPARLTNMVQTQWPWV